VNAFIRASFGGSGYDCMRPKQHTYCLLNNPTLKPVSFAPDFTENIYFVYLIKQNNKAAINTYQNNKTTELSKK
jgi:hypothetical protein